MVLPEPLAIERAGLRAWPAIEMEWDGSWVCRAANGYTRRANSVQCFDPADDGDIPTRVDAACRWFGERGLTPVFRVNLLTGPSLLAHLDAEGWHSESPSRLMAMPLGPLVADPRGAVLAIDDPAFLDAQRRLRGYDEARLAKLQAILAAMRVPARGVVMWSADGRPVASAVMAIADGIVVTGNVVTAAAERRRGLGSALMRTGLAWAREGGANAAALNVEADNAPAVALYESLGYRAQYDYVYRVKAPA
jgi:ribosomal protein S18 acetylase RimI-like enzyme